MCGHDLLISCVEVFLSGYDFFLITNLLMIFSRKDTIGIIIFIKKKFFF
jgi:hypothetical protein